MNQHQLRDIAKKYLDGTASEEEKQWLHEYYSKVSSEETDTVITDQYSNSEELGKEIFAALESRIAKDTPVIKRRFSWQRIAVAASVILALGLSSYFIFFPAKNTSEKPVAKIIEPPVNDALPGKDGAILTTADGKRYDLVQMKNGVLVMQGGLQPVKSDGQLSYSDASLGSVEYHTLNTPKGRKFELLLADGTKVWMDAGSSITYPSAFPGNERKVKATGQVYFEVAKDANKPFTVSVNKMDVQVLGTHFNINAYDDEASIKTTLLEGLIKVNIGDQNLFVRPGQQAQLSGDGKIKVAGSVDTDAVMAWKNGLFNFNNADLSVVLRQLARWYDVEIVYEGPVPVRTFEGKIGRNLNLSQVLKGLEKVGVKFRIDGKRLVVLG